MLGKEDLKNIFRNYLFKVERNGNDFNYNASI